MVEQWKPIEGYEGLYEISSYGRVISYHGRTPKVLALRKNKYGYVHYSLCKEGVTKAKLAHRLVAEAFIPNPNQLEVINHKDENSSNNYVDNLEWLTRGQNTVYGTAVSRRKKIMTEKCGVKIIARKNGMELQFDSISECARSLELNIASIYAVTDGVIKSTKGWSLERMSSKTEPNCKPKGKAVKAIRIEDGNEKVFDSVRQAASIVGGKQSNITTCLKGRQKSAYGYTWSYM